MKKNNFNKTFKKYFSKLNFLDYALVGSFFIVVVVFFLFFRREISWVNIRLKVTDEDILIATNNPKIDYASSFRVGDQEKDEIGQKVAEITGIESYNINTTQKAVYLDLNVKAIYSPRKQQYMLRGKPLIFGETFFFSFQNVSTRGVVVDFPGFKDESAYKKTNVIVHAQLRNENRAFSDTFGVQDYYANAVHIGDEVKNSKGEVMAKILDVKILPAKRNLPSAQSMTVTTDPLLKDVFYTIELSTTEIDGKKYMFNDLPVQIGIDIPLNFEKVMVFPTITDF